MTKTVRNARFMQAYNQAGSDVAAATILGVSTSSFYKWRKNKGLAAKGKPGRKYMGNRRVVVSMTEALFFKLQERITARGISCSQGVREILEEVLEK